MEKKRGCLGRLFILLMFLAAVGGIGAWAFGTRSATRLEFNHCELPQEVLPGAGPLSIALISDVHGNKELMELCVAQVEKEKPDLIIFAGDMALNGSNFSRTRHLIHLLHRLKTTAPTYAILGNQDYESLQQVERLYKTAGIPLLRNEALTWRTPAGAPLRIVGLGDWNEGDEKPERCMSLSSQHQGPVLLLSHDPESRHLLRGYAWNLMLSGHTHGGQLGNPITGKPICFRSDMPSGRYEEDGRHHVVSRGVGSIYDMRFFCAPEVVFIHVGAE